MAEIVELQSRDFELIRRIKRAFADVHRDDGVSWREAEELDNHGSPEELRSARSLDIDERWEDVPVELMDTYSSAVYFLDAKGLRYYLPAFMIADLQRKQWKSAIDDNFNSNLLMEKRINELSALLTRDQMTVVAEWLQWHDANRKYGDPRNLGLWNQFLGNIDAAYK